MQYNGYRKLTTPNNLYHFKAKAAQWTTYLGAGIDSITL